MKLKLLLCCSSLASFESLHVAGQELCLALAELDTNCFAHELVAANRSLLKQCAQDSDVCALGVADFLSDAGCVTVNDIDVVTLCLAVDEGAVDNEGAAGLDMGLELVQRRTVHCDNDISLVDQRRSNGSIAYDDGTVSGTATHLGALGR